VHGSAFAGIRFPPDVIVLAVRWYLRFALSIGMWGAAGRAWHRGRSDRDSPLGQQVHTVADRRGAVGRRRVRDRWQVDETHVQVAGRWVYLYRAID
jgi:transposase-like protein